MYRLFLAARYLLSRPINLLGIGGVTLGVWALIVVVSIFSGFLRVVGEHVRSASADVSVWFLPDNARFEKLKTAIEEDPNVASCAPRLVHFGLLNRPGAIPPPPPLLGRGALQGGDTPFVSVLGIDPELERNTTSFDSWLLAVAGERRVKDTQKPLARIDGLPAILLGEERMIGSGLRIGDRLALSTGRIERGADGGRSLVQVTGDTVGGSKQDAPVFVVAGAFHTQHTGYDGNTAFVHVEDLRAMLSLPPDAVQEVSVKVKDAADTEATADRVERAVRRELGFDRGTFQRAPLAYSWRERHQGFFEGVEWQRALMKIILIVIMVVAAVLMYATLSMMVAEKTSDIGILCALGGSPRGVMTVFLSCGLSITAVGIVLGTLIGCVSAVYLEEFRQFVLWLSGVDLFPVKAYNLDRVPHELDALWILQVAGVALLVGAVVSALPAFRAARHDPLVSLRGN
jgi:lipoprotein-releasing system permease protein